ncbi:retrovirus-related pol polyprotein from transposon TNT 1-94 [Tanacetum coccineum]
MIKKDSKIVKENDERKSIALKAKKESSDEEYSEATSEDKNVQRIRVMTSTVKVIKCFRCGDPNHLIGECPKPPKDKNQRAFVGGSWSDSGEEDDEKVKDETCLVAHAYSERDEFLAEKDKSRKRCHDYKDHPPPPPHDLDLSKRQRHDTDTSGSSQPPGPQSSAWKKSNTRDALSSSSKQQFGPHNEQPVEDIPIPDSANISDSKDTGSAHLPHVKPRSEWLKPIPEDDIPATLELAWVNTTSHVLDAKNNWANALATTYQALAENSLLKKTRDMRTFMNLYCQKMGKTKLTQADLEGQAYEVIKPFYPDFVHLQFKMEECHKMLTD